MRVLVLDPDDAFGREVVEQLGLGGVEAVYADTPVQMHAHMRNRKFQVVMVDLSLRRMNGFDIARELRMNNPANVLEIILVSPRHKPDAPEILDLRRDTEARFFYNKPLDYTALLAAINTPPKAAAPAPAPAPAPVPTPVAKVAAASPAPAGSKTPPTAQPTPAKAPPAKKRSISWDNVADLVEIWSQRKTGVLVLAGTGSGSAELVDGGLLDDAGRSIVKAALLGGVIAFRVGHVEGTGDWARLGRILFKGARAGTDARTLRRYMAALPARNDLTELARSLPLSDGARRFVGRINGKESVESILNRENLAIGEVSKDVVALVRLGLFEFHREGVSKVSAAAPVTEPKDSEFRAMNRANIEEAHAAAGEDQILARLERELETIKDAPPPVVLGIPADSDRSLVDRAGARMRQRYAEIVAKRNISHEVRALALDIAKRIDRAHRTFNFDAQISTGRREVVDTRVDEIGQMLSQSRQFIEQKSWEEADRVLAEAHKKQIDHVPVLANLGWARLHNPRLDLEVRTEEGRDFLLLAEEFDPLDKDGQYYLAQVLVASNRLDAAEQRAARALQSAPGDAAREALLRKIKRLRAQAEAKAR